MATFPELTMPFPMFSAIFSVSKMQVRAIPVLVFGLAASSAQAYIFEPISQERSVQLRGELNAFNFETRESSAAVFNDDSHSLPDGWDPLRMGMDIGLDAGNCFGQGIASQSLTAGSSAIQFNAAADVNISGFSSYPYQIQGTGSAVVNVQYRFKLTQVQEVNLSMNSSVGTYRDDDYTFAFKSAEGALIWASTGVVDESGAATRSFSRRFTLQPGEYTIAAQLVAISSLSGDVSFAGRTLAEFSVSAVPEPNSAWLGLAGGGMVLLALGARRRH